MRVLGIDPGIRATGFAVLEEISGRLLLMQSGEIVPPQSVRDRRLKFLFTEICQKIELYQPTVVALEDTFFAKNVKSALTLGQAKGVARLAAEMHDLPVFEYAPTAVKMAVVGFGGATKDQIKEMVFQILKPVRRMDSEHEADATAVAICHAHSAQWQAKQANL
jgi:crossover junction endodeoxyribonuclease RuvC